MEIKISTDETIRYDQTIEISEEELTSRLGGVPWEAASPREIYDALREEIQNTNRNFVSGALQNVEVMLSTVRELKGFGDAKEYEHMKLITDVGAETPVTATTRLNTANVISNEIIHRK